MFLKLKWKEETTPNSIAEYHSAAKEMPQSMVTIMDKEIERYEEKFKDSKE